ncbi:HEPN domain-containing protein [Roseibium sp.]|uniref:HEPN domain-containing protein n=1 Tax=Roseibium sp. TaxID=1936156 RepID=UPI003BACBB73
MANLAKIEEFRSEREPIFASWNNGKSTLYGALIWRDEQPTLQLGMEIDGEEELDEIRTSSPILENTTPATKHVFLCNTSKYGRVSLQNCLMVGMRASYSKFSNKTEVIFDFVPETIWFGAPLDELDGKVDSAVARDIRLSGFFGTPNLQRELPYGREAEEKFAVFGSPKEIWLWSGPNEWQIPMGTSGFSFGVNTSVVSTFSATTGYSLQSTVELYLHAKEPTTIEKFRGIIFELEQILSHYSIESFSFLSEELFAQNDVSSTLAWQMADDRDLFTPPLLHQVLADFRDRAVIEIIFDDWFSQTETVKLSRWLFTRSLKETESGLARFVAVSQAFEVLGREYGPTPKVSKKEHRLRLKKFRDLLEDEFDDEFIKRASSLVSASNSNSFRDVIAYMIGGALEFYGLGSKKDVDDLCKNFSDMRNTIVHMSDSKEGKLNKAFSAVNKMSLRLSFFYVLVQAYIAKLPLEQSRIESFLLNNRNARHGLNNEVLEAL